MDSIKVLVNEHDNILRMLDIIHRISLEVLDGSSINIDDFRKMADFIRKYADKIHHGKEEKFLFKAMTDELGNMGENLIRHGMLVEHDIARLYVSDLDASLDAYEVEPTAEARLSILVAAGSYEQLLRRHIQKENDVVFPFGENNLSAQSSGWVETEVTQFENEAANTERREHHLSVLNELEKKYA